MSSEPKLADIASNLDDISETLDEIKSAVQEGDCQSPLEPLNQIQQKIDRTSRAIDDVVDPD